jgi:hypothetical protein
MPGKHARLEVQGGRPRQMIQWAETSIHVTTLHPLLAVCRPTGASRDRHGPNHSWPRHSYRVHLCRQGGSRGAWFGVNHDVSNAGHAYREHLCQIAPSGA